MISIDICTKLGYYYTYNRFIIFLRSTKMEKGRGITCKYLDNIYVSFLTGSYTHCWSGWENYDYIPDYNKFLLPTDGEAEIVVANEKFLLEPGKFYLMPAGVCQSYYHVSSRHITKYWCHFTARVGNMNLFDVIRPHFCVNVSNQNEITSLFKKLINLTNQPESLSSVVAIKGIMLEIISYYLKMDNSMTSDRAPTSDTDFQCVLKYIEKNIEKKLTVEELADVMHLHPNYFIRYFKSFFGVSPIRFINNMRMDKAKQMLSEGELSVSQIAKCVGIDDIFYFSKQFKKYNGYAPTEYRHKI